MRWGRTALGVLLATAVAGTSAQPLLDAAERVLRTKGPPAS
jgi:hypothetical protein